MSGRSALTRAAFVAAFVLASCTPAVNYDDPTGPRYEGGFTARPDPEPALRIVTFNIQFAKNIDRAIELIQGDPHLRDADLLFLQEMDASGTERIAAALGMRWLYYPATVHPKVGHDFGDAILSRWAIRDEHKVLLPHLARFGHTRRIATACTVDVNGVPVRLYSVHLALPISVGAEGRRDQVRAVLADAERFSGPALVSGDFNSHGIGALLANHGFTWVSRRIGSTVGFADLDQVFVRGLALAPAGIGIVRHNLRASDHRPVWAVFDPPQASGTSAGAPAAVRTDTASVDPSRLHGNQAR